MIRGATVTQADREEASRIFTARGQRNFAQMAIDGRVDDWAEVQAFASHREDAQAELVLALEETWRVLRAAGLLNLTNGVQLGQTSWYVKACDAERLSDAAIAKAKGND